jgi:DNA-binding transcriptional ArsR family regulator
MSRSPLHPTREQIELPMVLDCLSDPTRLGIICGLEKYDRAGVELRCGDFNAFGAKSNLAYHFARLREAGLVQVRLVGTARYVKLRRKDLDARFPGLMDAVIKSASRDSGRLQLAECDVVRAG